METGSITGTIDAAQVALYVFWAFFLGLVIYLRREDHREGYPLEAEPGGGVDMRGSFLIPPPKTYRTGDGKTVSVPRYDRDTRALNARRAAPWPGAPIVPAGNPLVDGIGPAAWAERADVPDKVWSGDNRIVPSRVDAHYRVADGDPDPRGMPVFSADKRRIGEVVDLWADRAEHVVRFLEVEGPGTGGAPILVPMTLSRFRADRIVVKALFAAQFADVPRLKSPDQVTLLEEDKIYAYFSGGHLYASPNRAEPLL